MSTEQSNSIETHSRSEVAGKLQTVADLHGIDITEEHIEFSGIEACPGSVGYGDGTVDPVRVRFEEIASVSVFDSRVEVLLHSGYLYIFSTTDSVEICVNTHTGGRMMALKRPFTARDIGDNIGRELQGILAGAK